MSRDIVIKHNKYGIELVLSDKVSFEELLASVAAKFQESASFFKDAKLAVSFKGRELSEKEALAIVDAITENSSVQIICIMETGTPLEEAMKERVEEYQQQMLVCEEMQNPQLLPQEQVVEYVGPTSIVSDFYVGNLRSGQVLECASSITLVGDVNPGAKIISEGNIVVLGALKGNAHAGVAGDDNCFIFSLNMRPIQLQIGQYYAKSPDKVVEKKRFGKRKKENLEEYNPTIARAKDGNIYIEPMKKKLFG